MITATQVGYRPIDSKVWLALACLLLCQTMVSAFSVAAERSKLHIVAFGDSLTAGFGLPPGADFASRLEAALKVKGHDIRITNAGVSGDTTAGGLARFDWAVPDDADAVILELGANDALRGLAPRIARNNLDQILAKLKHRSLPVLIAGMHAPANWGDDYVKAFNAIFPELANKHGALLYPFFLDGVIKRADLKLADALHPNQAGVEEIVRRILPDVERLIVQAKSKAGSRAQ